MLTEDPQVRTEDRFRRKVRQALIKRRCPPERLDAEVEKVMQAGQGLKIDLRWIIDGP